MAYYNRNRTEDVAKALADLRYAEMQTLGRALANIANDRVGFLSENKLTPEGVADLLSDWAESVEMEIEAAKQKEEA